MTTDGNARRQALRTAWQIAPGVALAGIGGGIVFPILPIVGVQDGLSLAFIGVILAANRVGRVLTNPFVGMLTDRFGGKRMLITGLLIQAVVMAMYWLGVKSTHPGPWFLAARLVFGPGSGLVFIGGSTLALHASTPDNRGIVSGIVSAASGLGTPAGMVVGGIVGGIWGAGTAFLAALAAAVVAAAFAIRGVPDVRPQLTATRGRARIMLKALADARLSAVASLNLLGWFAVNGIAMATLALLVAGRHLEWGGMPAETASGLFLAMMLGASAAVTPLAGGLADRGRGRARVASAGMALMIPGFVLLALSTRVLPAFAALLIIGIGLGFLEVPLLAMVGDLVAPSMRGSAVGILQFFADVGGAVGPVVGTMALGAWGFTVPYLGTAGVVLLALPIGLWLIRAERATAHLSAAN